MTNSQKMTYEEFCEKYELSSTERLELKQDLRLWSACVEFKENPLTVPLVVVYELGERLLQRRFEWATQESVA
jgi:hypothetical protein